MHTRLLLALLFFVSRNASAYVGTTKLEAKLDVRVSEYSLSASGLADALTRVANQFRLPMGIEWVRNETALRNLNLAWKQDTVRAILSSVTRAYPGYAFRIERGVVHVFRRDLVNEKQNFLNLKVPESFEARDESGGFANQQLLYVVQNMVTPRSLPPGAGVGGDYATGMEEKPLTLQLGGVTVREALEILVEASEHKVWVVTFSDGSTLTSTGFLRTETLWHPTPFPDRDQPMWDFLAWGQ